MPARPPSTSQQTSISPTVVLTSASGTMKPRIIRARPKASAAFTQPRIRACRLTSSAEEPASTMDQQVPSSHRPPSLAPYPHFLDRLESKKPLIEVPIGLMPHHVLGYHQYLANLVNPNSSAFKLKDLKVDDIKPFILSVKASSSPIQAPLSQPVAMHIDSEDENEEPVPYIKDVNVAGKSLKAANIRKFSGVSDKGATIYYECFTLSLDFIFADPAIRLP